MVTSCPHVLQNVVGFSIDYLCGVQVASVLADQGTAQQAATLLVSEIRQVLLAKAPMGQEAIYSPVQYECASPPSPEP